MLIKFYTILKSFYGIINCLEGNVVDNTYKILWKVVFMLKFLFYKLYD